MTINEGHNATPVSVWVQLRQLMEEHPDAKIVTWFDEDRDCDGLEHQLVTVLYHNKLNTIELEFE